MDRKKRRIVYLIATCISLLSFFSVLFFVSPNVPVMLGPLAFPPIIFFFFTLFISIYFISGLIMKNAIHGTLISTFAVLFFLLRLNNLRSPIFAILLLALYIVLEIMITSRKK